MTHDEMIAVIQAHKEGKTIQCRIKSDEDRSWRDVNNPSWGFADMEYRIKPEKEEIPNSKFNKGDKVKVINYTYKPWYNNETFTVLDKTYAHANGWIYTLNTKDWVKEKNLEKYIIEPHYRLFKSAEEVMEAIRKFGSWLQWKPNGRYYNLEWISEDSVLISDFTIKRTFYEVFAQFTFSNGTPFGKLEE